MLDMLKRLEDIETDDLYELDEDNEQRGSLYGMTAADLGEFQGF